MIRHIFLHILFLYSFHSYSQTNEKNNIIKNDRIIYIQKESGDKITFKFEGKNQTVVMLSNDTNFNNRPVAGPENEFKRGPAYKESPDKKRNTNIAGEKNEMIILDPKSNY